MLKSKWCLVLGILAVGTFAMARDVDLGAGTVVPEGTGEVGTLMGGTGAFVQDGDVVFRNMASSGYFYTRGPEWQVWDDIQLEPGPNGAIIEYTMRVVGLSAIDPGAWGMRTQLWTDTDDNPAIGVPDTPIAGTYCEFDDIPLDGWVNIVCPIDPPVAVADFPGGFWLGYYTTGPGNGGPGIAGGTGTVGFSDDVFARSTEGGIPMPPTAGIGFTWFGGCPVCGSFRIEVIAEGQPWACCDLTTYDCANILETECETLGGIFTEGTLCNNLTEPCSEAGACCNTATGVCEDTFAVFCDGYLEGFFPGERCEAITCDAPPNVPTLTQWGMIALTVLLLTGLTIKFGRRRTVTA